MVKALLIHKDDNVAVVISQVKENDEVIYVDKDNNSHSIIANGSIPQYHKIAIKDIKENDYVIKYGEHIGLASCDIKAGDYVHTHNVKDNREDNKLKEK